MKIFRNTRHTGIALGAAILALGGLVLLPGGKADEAKVTPAPAPSVTAPARDLSRGFSSVVTAIRPAVVSVYSEKTVNAGGRSFSMPFGENGDDLFEQFFGRNFQGPQSQTPSSKRHGSPGIPQRGMGSGMILDKEGHILTNNHVVRDVDQIKVQLADDREFPAEVVGSDPMSDIAIIKIKGKVPDNLPIVRIGDSSKLQVGDWVLAIGAPFGLKQTVTAGIISATGRSDMGIEDYEDFIQTDAAINPGNSGGPLVNMDGEVIGMNTAIATQSGQFAGVGFAIPINMAKNYMPSLLKGNSIVRGFLGIVIQDINDALAKQFHLPDRHGALVAQVNSGSPADKAGLKSGDVITKFNNQKVENTRELRKQVSMIEPGTKVDMSVLRGGSDTNLSVTIGKMPGKPQIAAAKEGGASTLDKVGLRVATLTPEAAKQRGYEGMEGLLITAVEPGSPAALADLQEGDLITEVNHKSLTTVEDLRNAMSSADDGVLLLVKRNDASLYVVLKTS
jgi:serine protease Do